MTEDLYPLCGLAVLLYGIVCYAAGRRHEYLDWKAFLLEQGVEITKRGDCRSVAWVDKE